MGNNSLSLRRLIKALSLQNAVKYGGRARKEPVVGKLVSQRPELKQKVGEIVSLVEEVVEEVNALTPEAQISLLQSFPELLPREKPEVKEKVLTPLPKARRGGVVTRFSPNPDFVLHLGSARAAILSHDYARMYDGRFILRFEDTDPRIKRPVKQYYELIRQDLMWLGCSWDEEHIQSQRLETYYQVARGLLDKNAAYVCTCEADVFKSRLLRGEPCPDRNLPASEQLRRLEMMLNGGFEEGEAVFRVKTDLNHPNPALRDWPALRIIDTVRFPHPLTGSEYRVWPLYNFSCAIDDHLMGVTHVIRGVEHEVNELRQRQLFSLMGWVFPTAIHHGRLSVPGGVLSKSGMLKGLLEGLYSGLNDPRLATLMSLKRRGFQPEAIRRVVHEVGIRPSPAIIEWSNLEAYNRKIVDASAHRRFVVLEPFKMRIEGVSEPLSIEIRLHPDHREMGVRGFTFTPHEGFIEIYVEKRDVEFFRGSSMIRLLGLANIGLDEVQRHEGRAHLIDYAVSTALEAKAPIIHWVPVQDHVEVKILWSDGMWRRGLGEEGLLDEKVDNIIQMERVGYARVEATNESQVSLVFTHP